MYGSVAILSVVAPPGHPTTESGGWLLLAPLLALAAVAFLLACSRRGSTNTVVRCSSCNHFLPIRPASRYCPACGRQIHTTPQLDSAEQGELPLRQPPD